MIIRFRRFNLPTWMLIVMGVVAIWVGGAILAIGGAWIVMKIIQ